MIAVLEDTVERLALISLVPTAPDVDLVGRIPDTIGSPLISTIQQQWQLEESYRVLYNRPSGGTASAEEIAEQVNQSSRTLCRQLKLNSQATTVLKEHSGDPLSPHLLNCQRCQAARAKWTLRIFQSPCTRYLSDLTAVIFRRLSTTVLIDGVWSEATSITLSSCSGRRRDRKQTYAAIAAFEYARRDDLTNISQARVD